MAMRAALDHHNAICGIPARAFLLSPVDHELLPWEVLWGIPLSADDRIRAKRFRLDCGGSSWRIEDELDLFSRPA